MSSYKKYGTAWPSEKLVRLTTAYHAIRNHRHKCAVELGLEMRYELQMCRMRVDAVSRVKEGAGIIKYSGLTYHSSACRMPKFNQGVANFKVKHPKGTRWAKWWDGEVKRYLKENH